MSLLPNSKPIASLEIFEKRVLEELPVLYRVARRLTRSETSAEDLVGQAVFRAFKARETFDGLHIRSWLICILRNEFFADQRKKGIQTANYNDVEVEPVTCDIHELVADSMTVEQVLIQLEKLPEEYRLAVSLCDIEELSYEEVAQALEIPIGTVRSRLNRGRHMLRDRMRSHLSLN